ncbi:MAG: hypothetical protein LAO77_02645 [Acidobacteriia bacterium]|nr:hypothetical protein [Terriglobia bacterium]
MKKSLDHERRGVDLLLKRDNFEAFFDALNDEGFFSPDRNRGPVEVEPRGSFQVPYWAMLDYLAACARKSSDKKDEGLAKKVMTVVRSVSSAIRDNHHTARKLAEILGLLPPSVSTLQDMELVQAWLKTRFDRTLVAPELDEGAVTKFLASTDPVDWKKAARILYHCTAVRWEERPGLGAGDEEPVSVVEEYWLKEIVGHHASRLGHKSPSEAAAVFEGRVREVFGKGGRADWSYVFRPAVENNAQNHSFHGLENAVVEGLRDVVLAWCDVGALDAKTQVRNMLHSDVQMLRRIGLHVLGERWTLLQELYQELPLEVLFDDAAHIHELYSVLSRHFDELEEAEKATTIEAIKKIPAPEGEDSERRLKLIQLRWLSALSTTTYEPASKWLDELKKNQTIGLPEHPDYNAYMESSWGPGPSPYQSQELVAFAEEHNLVEKLNAFKPSESWRGPTIDALVNTLEGAVRSSPEAFLRVLPKFIDAASPYQHGVIRGFKGLWEASKNKEATVDWNEAWSSLLSFFEVLVGKPAFWVAPDGKDLERSQVWSVSAISDFLTAGMRDDEHAFSPTLLPRAWSLIKLFLEKVEPTADADDQDPMTTAINTIKGRTLEAMFSYALRVCRLNDKDSGSHKAAWDAIRPTFDAELKKCEQGNYEFATLCGAYFANIDYLDPDWLAGNLTAIFPKDRAANFVCAMGGLAYSAPTRRIYVMLRDASVIDMALRLNLKGRDTRQKLIERMMVGYIWGEDKLDSSRLSYAFSHGLVDDLEDGAWFFWAVRGEKLSNAQRAKILAYWAKCVEWAKAQKEPPAKLLSTLGNLAWAMDSADGENRELLLSVAPYMQLHHNVYELLEELNRLVSVSPQQVGDVLKALVDKDGPVYDYKDRLKALIVKLAEHGQKETALYCCNRLIGVPGMDELFKTITAKQPSSS